MKLPETGWTRDQIFTALAELRAGDLPTEGGSAFAYVYDSGERAASELAAEAYRMFLASNGLDPTAFPSLLRLENDVVVIAVPLEIRVRVRLPLVLAATVVAVLAP